MMHAVMWTTEAAERFVRSGLTERSDRSDRCVDAGLVGGNETGGFACSTGLGGMP